MHNIINVRNLKILSMLNTYTIVNYNILNIVLISINFKNDTHFPYVLTLTLKITNRNAVLFFFLSFSISFILTFFSFHLPLHLSFYASLPLPFFLFSPLSIFLSFSLFLAYSLSQSDSLFYLSLSFFPFFSLFLFLFFSRLPRPPRIFI